MLEHHNGFDYTKRPFLAIWETTHACDLACIHCRALAEPQPSPEELNHEEGIRLLDAIHEMQTPIVVFSGGDPLKRQDLPDLVSHAHSLGMRTGVIPAVTPLVTREKLEQLKAAGLDQIAFSLDAAKPEEHDAFRRVAGVFDRTLQCIQLANELGFSVQINSLINVHNTQQLDDLIKLVESFNIVFWEVFFLVPTGRGKELPLMDGLNFERAFEKIYALSKRVPFLIKITEAPHYRRFYMEQEFQAKGIAVDKVLHEKMELPEYLRIARGMRGSIGRAPMSVNSGKGFLFISYRGDIFPSGFLPLSAGNVRHDNLMDIYQNAPLFQNLRNPALLKGRCGICPFKLICGGSRSRAYAMTGDYLGEDPCCAYQPARVPSFDEIG